MNDFIDVATTIHEVPDANYYMFIGERSNGKTYSSLRYALNNFVENGSTFVYVRRHSESIMKKWMRFLFEGLKKTGELSNILKRAGYDGLEFHSGTFWATAENEKGKQERVVPIGYTMAINTWETGKGGSIPDCTTIIFDEFLTRKYYLPSEVILFENLVSSIVRERDDVKVLLLANTVSWTAPYFNEWGLHHVRDMKQGTYDVYNTGDGKRKTVVMYTHHVAGKKSDVYFNFDNPRSRMITQGTWETAEYPRIPENLDGWYKGEPFYVQSIEGWCSRIVPAQTPDGLVVLLVYESNKEILSPTPPYIDKRFINRVVYTDTFYPVINARLALTKHSDEFSKFILTAFKEGRVYYQNNTVGENIRNYLKYSIAYTPIPS